MAKKLFMNMEDNSSIIIDETSVQEDTIENNEDNAEISDVISDIREDLDTLEESISVAVTAETTESIIEDSISNDEPVSETTVELVQESINVFLKRVGREPVRMVPTLESYPNTKEGQKNVLKATLEGFKQSMVELWDKIKKFFSNIVAKVKEFFRLLTDRRERWLKRSTPFWDLWEERRNDFDAWIPLTEVTVKVPSSFATKDTAEKAFKGLLNDEDDINIAARDINRAIKLTREAYDVFKKTRTDVDRDKVTAEITKLDSFVKEYNTLSTAFNYNKIKAEELVEVTINKDDATGKYLQVVFRGFAEIHRMVNTMNFEGKTLSEYLAEEKEKENIDKAVEAEEKGSEEKTNNAEYVAINERIKMWWTIQRLSARASTTAISDFFKIAAYAYTIIARFSVVKFIEVE